MAKDQNLSLNPTKISGACGRLMCCLKYENDYYEEARAQLPDVGDHIETPEGNGKVVGLNILDISMQIKVEGLEQPLETRFFIIIIFIFQTTHKTTTSARNFCRI